MRKVIVGFVVGVAVAATVSLGAQAQRPAPPATQTPAKGDNVYIYGAGGSASCGTWVTHLTHDATLQDQAFKLQYEQWLLGFVSGYGMEADRSGARPLAPSDRDGLIQWMTTHCQAHPLDSVVNAAYLLVQDLQAKR
jgi:hypothetical protein